jgi:hypothetical protein
MTIIYSIRHEYETESGEDEIKEIGLYSTRQRVEEAIARLREKPGFSDRPEDFVILESVLDGDEGWSDGFIRAHALDPQRGAAGYRHGFVKSYEEIESVAARLKVDGFIDDADALLTAHDGIFNGTEMYTMWRQRLEQILKLASISDSTRNEAVRVQAMIDGELHETQK